MGEKAIQLHGGIGMTMEYKAGHYFKRLTMIDMAFGDSRPPPARAGEDGWVELGAAVLMRDGKPTRWFFSAEH